MKSRHAAVLVLMIAAAVYFSQFMVIGLPPSGLEYPTYTQSDTVSCSGKQCSGSQCWWPVYTQCYRAPEGNNIVLRSSVLTGGVFNNIFYVCPNGAYDPYPDNGITEAKCLGYCKSGSRVCDGDVLKVCNADGTDTINTMCNLGCVKVSSLSTEPSCALPHTPFGITITGGGNYLYGRDATVNVSVIVDDRPYPGIIVRGKILKDGGIISETFGYTGNDGVANLVFTKVEGVGTVEVVVSAEYIGKIAEARKSLYFSGEAVTFISTTYSYIQYHAKPIEFTVEVREALGKYVTPTMGTLTVISTMSGADILDNSATYIGDGKYKITSNVSGSGIYMGKVRMLYQGVNFDSKGIQVDVRGTTLEVDTSGIKPVALLGETERLRFKVTSSVGGTIEPDDIIIDIQYPDGYTTEKLVKSDLYASGSGVYEFSYTFAQLEKYTFNIYADKIGYTRGRSVVSIAVSSVEEEFNFIGFALSNILVICMLIVGTVFAWYMRRRK